MDEEDDDEREAVAKTADRGYTPNVVWVKVERVLMLCPCPRGCSCANASGDLGSMAKIGDSEEEERVVQIAAFPLARHLPTGAYSPLQRVVLKEMLAPRLQRCRAPAWGSAAGLLRRAIEWEANISVPTVDHGSFVKPPVGGRRRD